MDLLHGAKWALGLLSAGYAARMWLAKQRARNPRELNATPPVRIVDAVFGRVRLCGIVSSRGGLVTSPLTETACLAYEVMIELKMGHGTSPFIRLVDGAPFTLDDGSGLAEVECRASRCARLT